MNARKTPAAKCPWCEKIVRVIPCGRDWLNSIEFIYHRNSAKTECEGSCREVKMSNIIWPGATAPLVIAPRPPVS